MPQITWNAKQQTAARWAGQVFDRFSLLPGGAKIASGVFGIFSVTADGGAAEGATSLAVDALPVALPSGTVLNFGNHSVDDVAMIAVLTAAAAKGATSLAVQELGHAVEDNAAASYNAAWTVLESGRLIGRTYTERDAGTGYGPADVDNDDEIYLVAFDVDLRNGETDVELYRHGALVYENRLPGWSDMTAGQKAAIRARYQCQLQEEAVTA